MTCIAALRQGKHAWIGGDAALTGEKDSTEQIRLRKPKVSRMGAYLIGCAGNGAFDFVIESIRWPANHSLAWLTRDLPTLIRARARSEGIDLDGEALIACPRGIWLLDDVLSLHEPRDPFMALGTGSAAALGAFYAARRWSLPPEHKVRTALAAAARFDSCVRPPFKVLSC